MRIALPNADDATLRRLARAYALECIHLWPAPEPVTSFLRTGEGRPAAHKLAWDYVRSHKEDDSVPALAAYAAAFAASRNVKDAKYVCLASADYAIRAIIDAAGDPESPEWEAAFAAANLRQHELLHDLL